MSIIEYCIKKGFEHIRGIIVHDLINILQLLNENEKLDTYIGATIYKKAEDKDLYVIYYSFSTFLNEYNLPVIKENYFSGFSFSEIIKKEKEKNNKEKKNFSYLKTFFKQIRFNINNDNYFYIKTEELDKNFYIQVLVVADSSSPTDSVKNKVKEKIQTFLNKEILKCIPYSGIQLKLKKGKLLENRVIFIIDLERNEERKQEDLVYTDIVLTKKLIFDLKEIASEHNFKAISHTGDGFVFIYDEHIGNLFSDFNNLRNDLEEYLKNFSNYMSTLSKKVSNYKVKGILSKCKILYEFDLYSVYKSKLYFSSCLDSIFDDFIKLSAKKKNSKYKAILHVEKSLKLLKDEDDTTNNKYSEVKIY